MAMAVCRRSGRLWLELSVGAVPALAAWVFPPACDVVILSYCEDNMTVTFVQLCCRCNIVCIAVRVVGMKLV